MDDAVVRFFFNVAGSRGVLLVLDDLQWAAADALDIVRTLAHSGAPLRIIGAYRDNEMSSTHLLGALMSDLAHAQLLTHLALGPLSSEESLALLRRRLTDSERAAPDDVLARVVSRADGVPFFLVSWARGLQTGPAADAGDDTIPWNLTQSVGQRVSSLPEAAREVLAWGAVAGRRLPQTLIKAMASSRPEPALAGLDAACRAGLLEEVDEHGYQFVHDVVREVIEADLGGARRAALHGQIGLALERSGANVETLAYHFARSLDDEKAIYYLDQAGDLAEAQHANATAEGYFRELADRLDLLGKVGEAANAREKLGRVLTTEGRYTDALLVLEQSVRGHHREGNREAEARAAAQIGRVHYLKGTPEIGSASLEKLRQRLGGGAPSRAMGALNNTLAPLHMAQSHYEDQLLRAQQAGDIARTLGEEPMLAEAEVWRGCALNQLGDVEGGRAVLESAVALAEAANDLTSTVHATNDLGFLMEMGGEFKRSRAYRIRALDIAMQVGDQAAIANMTCRCAQVDYLLGEWIRAKDLFERSLSIARRIDAASLIGYPLFGLGLLALAAGDGDAVRAHAGECLALAELTADRQILQAGHALLAQIDLQEDRASDASARLGRLQTDVHGLELYSLLPVLAEACILADRIEEAERHIEIGMHRAQNSQNRVARVELLRVAALALIASGRPNEASSMLEEALDMARDMPYPFAEGRLLVAAAASHSDTGDHGEARRRLSGARAIFQLLGAGWHLSQVELSRVLLPRERS